MINPEFTAVIFMFCLALCAGFWPYTALTLIGSGVDYYRSRKSNHLKTLIERIFCLIVLSGVILYFLSGVFYSLRIWIKAL